MNDFKVPSLSTEKTNRADYVFLSEREDSWKCLLLDFKVAFRNGFLWQLEATLFSFWSVPRMALWQEGAGHVHGGAQAGLRGRVPGLRDHLREQAGAEAPALSFPETSLESDPAALFLFNRSG